jgi:dTDP-4-dehydrorhamnose reductase
MSVKIVVTGAYGQLGGELCRLLRGDALALDIDSLDLTDGPEVLKTLDRLHPDAVINCAAYTQVDLAESNAEECRRVNATAVEYLATACGRLDCPLVQVSTDYIFGGDKYRRTPYKENDPPHPQSVYAKTKLQGEHAAAEYQKHLIVRTCGLYARPEDERARNFVRTMLDLAGQGKPLRVVDDQWFSPSYAPHVARAILFLVGYNRCGAAPWGIYHLVNSGATTCYNFAVEIFRQAGVDVSVEPITTADYKAAAPRPAYSVLDTGAYNNQGGPPMPNWKAALAEYIEARGV